MCFESKSEYNPMDKSNEIFNIVKKYSPTADMISGDDFKYIKAVNSVGSELVIDIDSKELESFDQEDQAGLEQLADLLAAQIKKAEFSCLFTN